MNSFSLGSIAILDWMRYIRRRRTGVIGVNLSAGDWKDTVGEFGKPNPPAPFPRREGGAGKPLSDQGEGLPPSLIDQQHPGSRGYKNQVRLRGLTET